VLVKLDLSSLLTRYVQIKQIHTEYTKHYYPELI
jgi:hypothetical protein